MSRFKLVSPDTVEYTPELFTLLDTVNSYFNRFKYTKDSVQFNQLDYWTARMEEYEKGDCDDYALSKRKRLIQLGVPYQCLFPTVCTVEGVGHLVLVVRTTKCDYLLDNIMKFVKDVSKVTYKWYYRLNPVDKTWFNLRVDK